MSVPHFEPKGRSSRIPDFKSIEEESEWWDAHDIIDYLNVLRPVEVRVSPNLTSIHRFTVEVNGAEWKVLDHCERDRGPTPEVLARLWLVERLRQEDDLGRASG